MNQIGNTFSSREKFLNEFYSQSIRVIILNGNQKHLNKDKHLKLE